jgi:two-component system nitrate/nitrite response regulator NarL
LDKDPAGDPISVALATPPGAIRAGLRSMLSAEGIQVVYESSGLAAARELPPQTEVVILTPGAARGLDWTGLFTTLPGVALLFLLPEGSAPLPGQEVLRGRVWGALPLDADDDMLAAAIRALYQGLLVSVPGLRAQETPFTRRPDGDPADEEDFEALTPREAEILQQMTLGLTNKQIALALGISEHTVKYHISSVYAKLKAMNRAEAVSKGARLGIIEI